MKDVPVDKDKFEKMEKASQKAIGGVMKAYNALTDDTYEKRPEASKVKSLSKPAAPKLSSFFGTSQPLVDLDLSKVNAVEEEETEAIATKKAGDPKASPPADKQGGAFLTFSRATLTFLCLRLKRPSQSRRPL